MFSGFMSRCNTHSKHSSCKYAIALATPMAIRYRMLQSSGELCSSVSLSSFAESEESPQSKQVKMVHSRDDGDLRPKVTVTAGDVFQALDGYHAFVWQLPLEDFAESASSNAGREVVRGRL
ncbi:hypothetical protein IC582_021896 [Cucumis melo]